MGAHYNRFGKGLALPMKVLSLLVQKGGTGKSTLAALADALIDGRGVQELDAKGKAAGEIKAVWRWIKRRL